jgi:hypothetical protein
MALTIKVVGACDILQHIITIPPFEPVISCAAF